MGEATSFDLSLSGLVIGIVALLAGASTAYAMSHLFQRTKAWVSLNVPHPRYWWRNIKRRFRERALSRKRKEDLKRLAQEGIVDRVEDLLYRGIITRAEQTWLYNYYAHKTSDWDLRRSTHILEVKNRIKERRASGMHATVKLPGEPPPRTNWREKMEALKGVGNPLASLFRKAA